MFREAMKKGVNGLFDWKRKGEEGRLAIVSIAGKVGMVKPPNIEIKPCFIEAPDALLAWLRCVVTWDERMKARKTASFGVAYNYSQMHYAASPMPAELEALCALLALELGFHPNNCLINCYPDGDASMGFHSDILDGLAPATGVAIISVGSTRAIMFRSKALRSAEFAYDLPSGSLLYMSQQIQHDWVHAIPKSATAGERISLTFRSIIAPPTVV